MPQGSRLHVFEKGHARERDVPSVFFQTVLLLERLPRSLVGEHESMRRLESCSSHARPDAFQLHGALSVVSLPRQWVTWEPLVMFASSLY